MSNTIAGAYLAQISQMSLPYLQALLNPVGAFVTDFSDDVSGSGESVTTRYASNPVAVDLSSGFSPSNVSMTAKTITLNNYFGFVAAFTDVERSKSLIDLPRLFIEPMIQAVGVKFFSTVWNLVTAAAFPQSVEVAAASFDRDNLIDISATLTGTLKAPKTDRAFLCNPTYYAALLKTLNSAEFPGIILEKTEGMVPRVSGLDVHQNSEIDDNSESLAGFGAHKSALIFAGRRVNADGAAQAGVEVSDVLVPGLNLPVQFRRWYSPNDGQLRISAGLLWGAALGTGMGVRVTTPA